MNQSPSRSGFAHDIFKYTVKLRNPVAIVAMGLLRVPLLATPVQSPTVDAQIDFGDGLSGRFAYEESSNQVGNKIFFDPKPEVSVPLSNDRSNQPEAKTSRRHSTELIQSLLADDTEPLVIPVYGE